MNMQNVTFYTLTNNKLLLSCSATLVRFETEKYRCSVVAAFALKIVSAPPLKLKALTKE